MNPQYFHSIYDFCSICIASLILTMMNLCIMLYMYWTLMPKLALATEDSTFLLNFSTGRCLLHQSANRTLKHTSMGEFGRLRIQYSQE